MTDSLATTRNHEDPSPEPAKTLRARVSALWSHRRRLAPLVVVAAVVLVAVEVEHAVPRDVRLRFDLGADHGNVTEARIVYSSEGEVVHGVRFGYPEGAPEVVAHDLELTPGRYVIEAALRGPELDRRVEAAVHVPVDGTVRVDLSRGAPAR